MREQKVQDGLNETEEWRKRRWDADGVEKNECSGEKNNKGRIAEGGKWSKPSQGFCQRLRADSKETGVNLITHSAISSEHKQKLWKKTVGICHYFTYCFWEGLGCLETAISKTFGHPTRCTGIISINESFNFLRVQCSDLIQLLYFSWIPSSCSVSVFPIIIFFKFYLTGWMAQRLAIYSSKETRKQSGYNWLP